MSKKSMMDEMCKFKVGEIVQLTVSAQFTRTNKHYKTPLLQIIERQAKECSGGVQIFYDVRPHNREGYGYASSFTKETFMLSEIELANYEEPTQEND